MEIIKKGKQVRKNTIDPKALLIQLIGDSDYAIAETGEEIDSHLHVLLYPIKENPLLIINVHLWISCKDEFALKYLFAAKPKILQDQAELLIKQYTDWWNEQNDYELVLNHQNNSLVVLTTDEHSSMDWNDLVKEFQRIERLWEVDTLCYSMSIMGISELEELEKMKKTVMENES